MRGTIIDFIVAGLATWRLSYMLVREAGPFNVFGKLREATGIEYDDNGELSVWNPANPLACMYCTSVWVALGITFLPCAVVRVLAISGLAVLIEKHGN